MRKSVVDGICMGQQAFPGNSRTKITKEPLNKSPWALRAFGNSDGDRGSESPMADDSDLFRGALRGLMYDSAEVEKLLQH